MRSGLDPMVDDHHARMWIGPPPAEGGIQYQASEYGGGEGGIDQRDAGLPASGTRMASVPQASTAQIAPYRKVAVGVKLVQSHPPTLLATIPVNPNTIA